MTRSRKTVHDFLLSAAVRPTTPWGGGHWLCVPALPRVCRFEEQGRVTRARLATSLRADGESLPWGTHRPSDQLTLDTCALVNEAGQGDEGSHQHERCVEARMTGQCRALLIGGILENDSGERGELPSQQIVGFQRQALERV